MELLPRLPPLLVLLLVAVGCHAPPAAQFPTADSAIARLRAQTDCSRAVQGEAKLSFAGGGRRLNGQILYLAKAPDSLRFDVFSSFGVTLSTLTSDGERFALYNLQEKSFFYGPAKTCNVQRFTRVPVPASALVEILRGRPPVLVHDPASTSIRYHSGLFSRGDYQIAVVSDHQATQTLRLGVHPDDWDKPVSRQRLRLLGVSVSQAGEPLYEVALSGHRPVSRAALEPSAEEREMGISELMPSGPACDAELPSKVAFYVPETGYELTFRNEEQVHNPPLGPGVFRQTVPGGVLVRESNCVDP